MKARKRRLVKLVNMNKFSGFQQVTMGFENYGSLLILRILGLI